MPIFFLDDFYIVALIWKVMYTLMISGTNILDCHGVSIFIFNGRVNSVFVRKLVCMTMLVVPIRFENGVKLLTETVDFIGTNLLFSTMKSRLNFNVPFIS